MLQILLGFGRLVMDLIVDVSIHVECTNRGLTLAKQLVLIRTLLKVKSSNTSLLVLKVGCGLLAYGQHSCVQ